jgi:hypothetical protein
MFFHLLPCWVGSMTKSFTRESLASGLARLAEKFDSILLKMDVRLDSPFTFVRLFDCLFAAFRASVQVTLLSFARLERSRTPTLHAWDLASSPDCTLSSPLSAFAGTMRCFYFFSSSIF